MRTTCAAAGEADRQGAASAAAAANVPLGPSPRATASITQAPHIPCLSTRYGRAAGWQIGGRTEEGKMHEPLIEVRSGRTVARGGHAMDAADLKVFEQP